ncbi:MAG: VCBS repeat-containing protein [Desulfosarcinaceae bacterium]|nr:VCBS repeat-containing protein [Desulfosarcinaceae bacterium]
MKSTSTPWVAILICSLITVIPLRAVAQSPPKRVLVLPFQVHAPQEYAYLQEGIRSTLVHRLQQPGVSQTISEERVQAALAQVAAPHTPDTAKAIGPDLDADLAITGSVTIVGAAARTFINVWQLPDGTELVRFQASGERPDEVLAHVDQFVDRLNAEVLQPSAAAPSATAAADPDEAADTVAATAEALIWQSPHIDTRILGLAVADLGPTPGRETAIIDSRHLWVYRIDGSEMHRLQEVSAEPFLELISVDAADLNGNGWAEIFVTAIHPRLGQLRSFVVEWNGQRYATIASDLNRYFRVIGPPAGTPTLISQEMGLKRLFGAAPQIATWREGGYPPGAPIELPPKATLYDFISGAIDAAEADSIVILTRHNRLMVYRSPQEPRWTSEETYGGSSVYLDEADYRNNQERQQKGIAEERLQRIYIHPRMVMTDLDEDGQTGLLVVKNTDAAGGLFRRSRLLTSGQVVCLQWQQFGLVPKWHTPKVSGHINDIALADLSGDGRQELIYAVVDRHKKGLDGIRSYLVVQALP